MRRFEQAIPAGIITLVGLWVAWISYTQAPAAAFVFPRLVSTVFVVLAVWVFVQTLIRGSDEDNAIAPAIWKNILPGLLVAGIYVFWAAKSLGFYTATAFTVFVLISIYDTAPHASTKSWIRRLAIAAGFMAVMYLLFAKLLGVFTPREILFR